MAQYPNEAPPVYEVNDPQPKAPKWRWWWRKRVWMPILLGIFVVLFGIIFGAVYGVKQAQLENAERDRDRLLAALNGTSSTSSHGPTATSSHYPYPTPAPLLKAQGDVPRDISAAAEAPRLLIWDLRDEGRLWRRESWSQGVWEVYPDRQFLFAPVSVGTGDIRASNEKQTAVSIDAISGRIVYMHFHDGEWGDWQELEFGAQFLRRPAVISRAQDRVDVFNIDSEGVLWIVSYDGSAWSEWTELGADMAGEVSATSWSENRIDVFARHGESVMHKHWVEESGWAQDWDDLGTMFPGYSNSDPDSSYGSPLAVSWVNGDDGVIDVFATDGSSRHKLFQAGQWSDWLIVPASHEGLEFKYTQSIARGRGGQYPPYAHIVSRGTNNCIHYASHTGTEWDGWYSLWCIEDSPGRYSEMVYPTEFLPTSVAVLQNGNLEVVVKDLFGDVIRQQLVIPLEEDRMRTNENWTNVGQPS